jgi:hypothetical protein
MGVRVLFLVNPQVGVELGGLRDVRKASRLTKKAAERQIINGLEGAVAREVHHRPGFEHQAFRPGLRQNKRGHPAPRRRSR